MASLRSVNLDIMFLGAATIGQFGNTIYELERCKRLTASNFGAVIKRKLHTPCHNLVKRILYPAELCTSGVLYGKQKEAAAVKSFETMKQMQVTPAGLFVDIDHGYLAASPDGMYISKANCKL